MFARVSMTKNLHSTRPQQNPAARFMGTTTRHVPHFARTPGNAEQPDSYNSGGFYPVHLGDLIANRYRVLQKLGWGTCATVWLARDENKTRYVALKITAASGCRAREEVGFLTALRKGNSNAIGLSHCQRLLDNFELEGPNGLHQVLGLQTMGKSLEKIMDLQYAEDLNTVPRNAFLKRIVTQLLLGFHHIHSRGLVHRDIQPANVLLQLDREFLPPKLPEEALQKPFNASEGFYHLERIDGKKMNDSAPLYVVEPRPLGVDSIDKDPFSADISIAICDFGAASTFDDVNDGFHAFPRRMQPPELTLGLPMQAPQADIWGLGCLIYQVFALCNLFYVDGFSSREEQKNEYLQSITEILGPLPKSMLKHWQDRNRFVDEEGNLLSLVVDGGISEPLEHLVMAYKPADMGDEEAFVFLDFLQCMLAVEPAKRALTGELLKHPWLKQKF